MSVHKCRIDQSASKLSSFKCLGTFFVNLVTAFDSTKSVKVQHISWWGHESIMGQKKGSLFLEV